jgi:hypothetical protein
LTAERTVLGPVVARATVHGRPVAYTRLRSTYFHELDSAVGFQDLNEPAMVQSEADFEAAVSRIGWAFNWVYSDPDDIGYATSGVFPVRAAGVDPGLPIRASARNVWRGWDPSTWMARTVSRGHRPRVADPRFIASWGNKPARGWRSPGDTSVGQVDLMAAPLRRLLRAHRTLGLAGLIRLTSRAASTDLRAYSDLPLALRVLGRPTGRLGTATATLRHWWRDGALRRRSHQHGASADSRAIAVFDAWWPRWLRAEFQPTLGRPAFAALRAAVALDARPGGAAPGTAYSGAWPGYVNEDLRRLLQRPAGVRRSGAFCGRGVLVRCRRALRQSLSDAINASPRPHADAEIVIRTLSGRVAGRLPWADRPSYQMVVSVHRRVASPPPLCGPVRDVASARTVALGPSPLIIGDSVLLGALTELAQAGFEVDAHACRHVREALDDLQARAAAGTLPRLVVLELGTDGTVEPADIDRALAILGPNRVLALVTPREAFRTVAHDARVMRAAASRYPGRVLVLDWVATSAGHDDWFQSDGIHLTPAGAVQFAALAATALPWA